MVEETINESKITFEEYVVAASNYSINSPNERMGQAYYNTLSHHRSTLAREVNGTRFDPFFNDDILPYFFSYIAARWEQ